MCLYNKELYFFFQKYQLRVIVRPVSMEGAVGMIGVTRTVRVMKGGKEITVNRVRIPDPL